MLLLYAILLTLAAEGEAVRLDGRHTPGTLTIERPGRLHFSPNEKGALLPVEAIGSIRFPERPLPANRPCVGVRVVLRDGQHISGQLLSLDDKTLSLRPAWAEKIELPRAAVACVTQLTGWRTLVEDDFRDGGKAWTLTGKPSFDTKAGQVTLAEKGQSLTFTPPTPIDGGRVGIAFVEPAAAHGGLWTVEAAFGKDKQRRLVRIMIAGSGDAYEVDAGNLAGVSRRVPRTPGLHRLLIQFTAQSLRITLDDHVLWYNLDVGPGGPLRQVRLAYAGTAKNEGTLAFSEFFLARAVEEPKHPPGDVIQDELWHENGDQLFGRLLRADGRNLEFDCQGKRTLPWSSVHGIWFRRVAAASHTSDGAHVRLAVRTCLSAEPDRLEGVATALDDKALSLRHTLLGDLRIERERLHSLQPLFHGARIEIDNAFHHLGDPQAFSPQLQPPRAEGLVLRRSFTLNAVPDEARLVLTATELKGAKETAARTLLYLNGERLDELNRHVDKAQSEPRRLTLSLPKERLRKGENVLELKLTPSPETGRVERCGVFGLVVEMVRD